MGGGGGGRQFAGVERHRCGCRRLHVFRDATEIPITQALLGAGMGKGPALALLLAGPALSLPSMLVIRGFLGTQKTLVYVGLVVVMATITGMVFGTYWG